MSDEVLSQIQQMLDSSPFIKSCGMKAVSFDADGQSLGIKMPLKPDFERIPGSGQFHGGPIASLIDTAGCFVLVALLQKAIPTISFRADYLRPAVNTDLVATAVVRRAGKAVGVVDVDVVDNESRLVAVGRGTFGV